MKRMKMNRISIALLLLVVGYQVEAQNTLTLGEVLQTAQQQSLDAFRAKNVYLSDYWEFQSYKSNRMPHLTWYLNPASFNRRMVSRYDFDNNVEVYRQQQTLSSYSQLSLSQNIFATGGNVYVQSDIYRLQNLGNETVNSWSSTPFRIGFEQPLFGFNSFKWNKLISPLNYEKARQEFIQSEQVLNKKAVALYFNLLLAKVRKEIAAQHVASADTLYAIGLKRFDIASVQKEELLNLELSKFNSKITLAQAEKDFEKARFNLNSFLGFSTDAQIEPVLPTMHNGLLVDAATAVELALMNNPDVLTLRQKELNADRTLDQAVRTSRFSANVSASYGLNQSSETFNDVYRNPLDQQMVGMSLSIPILDWGDSKGRRQIAQKQKEIVDIEVKQALIDFRQEVTLKVIDFNLQAQVVASSAKADSLARESFELTKKRFVLGNADVLKLTSAMTAQQQASEIYVNSLATYWNYFYEVMELTLYDFVNRKTLSANFDALVEGR